MAENPHLVGKALRGQLEGRYSARRGEFRVVYQVFDDRIVVRVIGIAHRRDVYR
ncbi:type II toxin-antitoxin system RelE family toxin [Mycolicibacterium hodleri]|uniref:type II toxin-antitoxin system RelE family toxin n=1 Tax=Mycolicibacterium hodleri TaxID=49897 RepID=UPI003183D7C0